MSFKDCPKCGSKIKCTETRHANTLTRRIKKCTACDFRRSTTEVSRDEYRKLKADSKVLAELVQKHKILQRLSPMQQLHEATGIMVLLQSLYIDSELREPLAREVNDCVMQAWNDLVTYSGLEPATEAEWNLYRTTKYALGIADQMTPFSVAIYLYETWSRIRKVSGPGERDLIRIVLISPMDNAILRQEALDDNCFQSPRKIHVTWGIINVPSIIFDLGSKHVAFDPNPNESKYIVPIAQVF